MQFWHIFACVLLGTITNCQEVTEATQKAARRANSQFALDLLRELSKDGDKSVFFSPLSISVAFAMTSLGTSGQTLAEINRVFHFDQVYDTSTDPMALHQMFKAQKINKNENKNYILRLANRLFGQKKSKFPARLLNDTENYYGAALQQIEFNGEAENIINQWVDEQTHGKIKNIFERGSLTPDTVLVLVNAIYFKSDWRTKFNVRHTQNGIFEITDKKHKIVDMMQMTTEFNYYQDDEQNVQVLEMPYVSNDLSMIVILPELGKLQTLISKLTAEKLDDLISNLESSQVEVKFPKFTLEKEYSLTDTLQLMGIKALFGARAKPHKADDEMNVYLSQVQHAAMVKVDENGSVAAAATRTKKNMFRLSAFQTPRFIANHPFLFAIRDNRNQELLFLGSVIDFA